MLDEKQTKQWFTCLMCLDPRIGKTSSKPRMSMAHAPSTLSSAIDLSAKGQSRKQEQIKVHYDMQAPISIGVPISNKIASC